MKTNQCGGVIFSTSTQLLGCRPGGIGEEMDLSGLWLTRQPQESFPGRKLTDRQRDGSWSKCERVVMFFSWCPSWVRKEIRVNRLMDSK